MIVHIYDGHTSYISGKEAFKIHKIRLILFSALQIAIKWQRDCVRVYLCLLFTEYIQHEFAV